MLISRQPAQTGCIARVDRAPLASCSFIDNTAQLNGGAFSADGQSANIFVTSTLLESNNAFEGEGGGMYLAGTSEVTMTKVNVRACFAGSNGGGASVRGESSLILENDVNIRNAETNTKTITKLVEESQHKTKCILFMLSI